MKREQGVALIVTILSLSLLTLLGLAVSFNAITELRISQNHQSAVQALEVAEEGLNQAKEYIRRAGLDLDEALRMNPQVPSYEESYLWVAGTYGYRYPISVDAARRLKIFFGDDGAEEAIEVKGTKEGYGIITRSQIYPDLYPESKEYLIRSESEIRGASLARRISLVSYFAARVTNNLSKDEVESGGSALVDKDNKILIRSVGIVRSLNPEIGGWKSGNNSVAVVEALLRRDISTRINAPFLIDAPSVNARFDGNTMLFDGYNHRIRFKDENGKLTPSDALADIATISSEGTGASVPNHGPANAPYDSYGIASIFKGNSPGQSSVLENLKSQIDSKQADNFIGRKDQVVWSDTKGKNNEIKPISLGDITAEISTPNTPTYNEDATRNLLNAENLSRLIKDLRAVADVYFPSGAKFGGNNVSLGTVTKPQITFVDGDLEIAGNGQGYGVIVTTGKLKFNGAFNFVGVIIATGGEVTFGGANKTFIGGLLAANLQGGSFGTVNISVGGNSDFYYSGDAIRFAINRLPFEVLAFREVRNEYELGILNKKIVSK